MKSYDDGHCKKTLAKDKFIKVIGIQISCYFLDMIIVKKKYLFLLLKILRLLPSKQNSSVAPEKKNSCGKAY